MEGYWLLLLDSSPYTRIGSDAALGKCLWKKTPLVPILIPCRQDGRAGLQELRMDAAEYNVSKVQLNIAWLRLIRLIGGGRRRNIGIRRLYRQRILCKGRSWRWRAHDIRLVLALAFVRDVPF